MKQSEQLAVTKLFDKDSTIRESQVIYMYTSSNVRSSWYIYYMYIIEPGAKLYTISVKPGNIYHINRK